MEENNKFETNMEGQAGKSGQSSVYGTGPAPMQFGNGQPMGQPSFYGQPTTGGQPNFGPMPGLPPFPGVPTEEPKKKKRGLVVGILCAAAVVIVIAAGVLLAKTFLGGDPEKQLAKGTANMAAEMAAYQSSVAEDIGLAAFKELQKTEPIHMNVDLSITDPNALDGINNISVGLDGVTDYKSKMAEYDVSVGTYGFDMDIGTVVAADNKMYLSVPILFDEVYSLDLTNLGRDFNGSAWADVIGETIPEDYSLTLFGDTETADGAQFGLSELSDIIKRQSSVTADSIEVEKIKQKREFMIGGTVAECGGVRVTMDKDAFNLAIKAMGEDILASDYYEDFMKGFQTTYAGDFDEFKDTVDDVIEMLFGARFEQDIVLDYYLDQKGRIVNISTPEDIAVSRPDSSAESYAIDINFSGAERTLDSIEGGVYMKSGDDIFYMGISRNARITEDFYSEDLTLRLQEGRSEDEITFRYANEWGYTDQTFDLQMVLDVFGDSIELSANGGFTDIVKGEGYTFQIDSAALRISNEDLLRMTGSVEMGVTQNHIDVPQNAIDILGMSETDIMNLLYDVY